MNKAGCTSESKTSAGDLFTLKRLSYASTFFYFVFFIIIIKLLWFFFFFFFLLCFVNELSRAVPGCPPRLWGSSSCWAICCHVASTSWRFTTFSPGEHLLQPARGTSTIPPRKRIASSADRILKCPRRSQQQQQCELSQHLAHASPHSWITGLLLSPPNRNSDAVDTSDSDCWRKPVRTLMHSNFMHQLWVLHNYF